MHAADDDDAQNWEIGNIDPRLSRNFRRDTRIGNVYV